MSQVVKLFDEIVLMGDLKKKTIELIHATINIDAIKKLVIVYDIVDLNLEIEKRFKEYEENPPWDIAALRDLNKIRIELVLFYRTAFTPFTLLDGYNNKMVSLLNVIQMNRNLHLFT